jgi:hypothetical protein
LFSLPGASVARGGNFHRSPRERKPETAKSTESEMKPFCRTRETNLKQAGRRSSVNKRRQSRREAQMNHSFHSADRSTHLKIVVVALVAGIAVASFAIIARTHADFAQTAQTQVIKAGKPMAVTSSEISTVR